MVIDATNLYFKELNERISASSDAEITINNCLGQRYIGAGLSGKIITVNGVPGNALGAYMNDSTLIINGNAQDATGDTMNGGTIIINGSSGDATGYAMRGGRIYVRGNVGYRAGIHMKAYQEHKPTLVIGGETGSFLGEYQAGGTIIVLGLEKKGAQPVGSFCGTGMHGGVIYLRSNKIPHDLPAQVMAEVSTQDDLQEIRGYVTDYCQHFALDAEEIMREQFVTLRPNTRNPYKRLYTAN